MRTRTLVAAITATGTWNDTRNQPQAFIDMTPGSNALSGGSCCPARTGYDLATGLGSPLANAVAALLPGPG